MNDLYRRFDGVFFEKTRLSIMTILYREEKASFTVLKSRLEVSDGAVYTHTEKLVQAGYVEKTRELVGTTPQTVYGLTDRGRAVFEEYVDFLEEIVRNTRERSR